MPAIKEELKKESALKPQQPPDEQGEYFDEHTGKRYKRFFKNGRLNGEGTVIEKDGKLEKDYLSMISRMMTMVR